MSTSVSFAKIAGHASETRWSQIYHAGDLFAAVSLSAVEDHPELNSMGKEVFNSLEADFFSLEEKKLTTIKSVIADSIKSLPEEVTLSAAVAYSKDSILYLFLIGSGEIMMRRGEKIGVLLSQKQGERSHILSSSGYLQHGDMLLLKTGAFSDLFSTEDITEALDFPLPNAIIEHLTAKAEEVPGDAAALVLMYQGTSAPDAPTAASEMRREHKATEPSAKEKHEPDEDAEVEIIDTADEEELEEKHEVTSQKAFHVEGGASDSDDDTEGEKPSLLSRIKLPSFSRRMIFGAAAVLLIIILVGSILFTRQHSQNVETKSVYEQTMREAQEKYDEAEGLKNLNASLAQNDYKKSQEILKAGLAKIQKGSEEEKNLQELLAKVESNLKEAEGETVNAQSVDASESPLLELAAKKGTAYVTDDAGNRFALLGSGVVNEKDEEVIKNEDGWEKAGGIAGYNGNLYILDKSAGVLKYSDGSDGYGKSNYFSGDAPSLTNATSIAIDGSVYILFSDGGIKKYSRGKEESFSLSGMPSPLKNPTQIFTNGDIEELYILDRGNSRVVVLSKEGLFKKAYKATALANASAIDVHAADKRLYLLQGKNVLMIPLE